MEILRASLEVLFTKMNPSRLLKKGASGPVSWFSTKDGNDWRWFVDELQRNCEYLTLDHCEVAAEMVASFYINASKDIPGLTFSKSPNIFNALLHFSGRVLSEANNNPICGFEHILRWSNLTARLGEDLFTTSFLASKDLLSGNKRNLFDWSLVIEHDNNEVNAIFSQEMADVHMHLGGSSSNFDLSWLSLMIYPSERRKQFKKLLSPQKNDTLPIVENSVTVPVYCLVVKACAIRYYLYLKYLGKSDKAIVHIILDEMKDVENCAEKMESRVNTDILASLANMSYVNHDYINPVTVDEVKHNPNCLLCGERFFLYSCFQSCYSGKMSNEDQNFFYAYLLIKNKVRNELIQNNKIVGFRNFSNYERQKTLFLDEKEDFKKLVEPLALGQYFDAGRNRYIEPRITPKKSSVELHKYIEKLDKRIQNYSSATQSSYHYVLHFIKKDDNDVLNNSPINPRHNSLRDDVKQQAMAIDEFRSCSPLKKRVVGVDAANSEIFARPEVFAQAFRFLRNHKNTVPLGEQVNQLGITYHVGEDFLSPLDGLRAVDEVLRFIPVDKDDRLGHALVLGINAVQYLIKCHHTLLLPKQVVIDDLVWCFVKMAGNTAFNSFKGTFENEFYKVFNEVYGKGSMTIQDYYDSWLLRGDNPGRYESYATSGIDNSVHLADWDVFDFNDDEKVNDARKNNRAAELYYRYHFDVSVRELGKEVMEIRYPKGFSAVIAVLQENLIKELSKRKIAIETNPTSNLRIGGFERYCDLPVMILHPANVSTSPILSVSVNTDDRGVFATSLEREFSLLACALSKGNPEPGGNGMPLDKITSWLNELRNNALAQRFIKIFNQKL